MASSKEIPPGGEGKIKVTFKTKNRRGKSRKTVTVTSNDPVNPKIKLEVSAELEVLFGVKPTRIWFGRVSRKKPITKSIEFTGRDLEKTNIKDVTCLNCEKDAFTWKINDQRSEKEKKLTMDITLHPDKLTPDNFNYKLKITTDNKDVKEIIVGLSGQILGPISAKPQRLYLANFEPGKTMNRTITIFSPEDISFAITNVKVDSKNIKILSFDKKKSTSHDIKISFTPEKDQTRVKAELLIDTDLKEQPQVKVPIHGYKRYNRKKFNKKNNLKKTFPDLNRMDEKKTERNDMTKK